MPASEPDRLAISVAFLFLAFSAVAVAVEERQAAELLAMLAYLSVLAGIVFAVARIRFGSARGEKS